MRISEKDNIKNISRICECLQLQTYLRQVKWIRGNLCLQCIKVCAVVFWAYRGKVELYTYQ